MTKIRKILVAIKEPESRRPSPGVLKAAQLARACDAELVLCHCLTQPVYVDIYTLGENKSIADLEWEVHQAAVRRLENIADRLRTHGIRVSISAEWDYPAHEAIIRCAQQCKADLIVAERHAGSHGAAWLLQLTDWELVRWSPLPLLLVKDPHPYRHPVVLAAVDPSHAFEKPLKLDAAVLDAADTVSGALRGTLHAVHAYVNVPLGELPPSGVTESMVARVEKQARSAAQEMFDKALSGVKILRANRHLIGRHPIDAISEAARMSHSHIVAMGAISRTGIKRLLIGNTAERIIDELTCDILVIKPQGFRTRVPAKARGPRLMTATDLTGYY